MGVDKESADMYLRAVSCDNPRYYKEWIIKRVGDRQKLVLDAQVESLPTQCASRLGPALRTYKCIENERRQLWLRDGSGKIFRDEEDLVLTGWHSEKVTLERPAPKYSEKAYKQEWWIRNV